MYPKIKSHGEQNAGREADFTIVGTASICEYANPLKKKMNKKPIREETMDFIDRQNT